MDSVWEQVWSELRASLEQQPRCAEHPEHRCIRTLAHGVVNDILQVDASGVRVRSHRTRNVDVIPASALRAWWVHLEQHGTAALSTEDPNSPRSGRASLVGAILVRCLPHRIEWEGRQIRLRATLDSYDLPLPEELPASGALVEGARRALVVNAYERDPEARRRCILAHGTSCTVCGINLGAVYGEAADGLIHVHHLRPLSQVGTAHDVDPVEDLRPVCPNCHAVIHRREPAFEIEEVRAFLMKESARR